MDRRRAVLLILLGGLASLAVTLSSPARAQSEGEAGAGGAGAAPRGEGDEELGRRLFATGCSSCHGLRGEGTARGPSLEGAGAAAVDFWVSTGRMPLERSTENAVRKPPAYDREQIEAIVAYVASLAPGGPPIPRLDVKNANVVKGGELFRANCVACHGAVGTGGALASARHAPPLRPATALQIAEAVRIGPGAMPSFGPDTLDDEQVASIVKYVELLDNPEDAGGSGLGHTGPIPEGFVGWIAGLGAVLVACWWIGERE